MPNSTDTLAAVDKVIAHVVEAIALGGQPVGPLLETLRVLEGQWADLVAEIAAHPPSQRREPTIKRYIPVRAYLQTISKTYIDTLADVAAHINAEFPAGWLATVEYPGCLAIAHSNGHDRMNVGIVNGIWGGEWLDRDGHAVAVTLDEVIEGDCADDWRITLAILRRLHLDDPAVCEICGLHGHNNPNCDPHYFFEALELDWAIEHDIDGIECPFCASKEHTRLQDCPEIDPEQLILAIHPGRPCKFDNEGRCGMCHTRLGEA